MPPESPSIGEAAEAKVAGVPVHGSDSFSSTLSLFLREQREREREGAGGGGWEGKS